MRAVGVCVLALAVAIAGVSPAVARRIIQRTADGLQHNAAARMSWKLSHTQRTHSDADADANADSGASRVDAGVSAMAYDLTKMNALKQDSPWPTLVDAVVQDFVAAKGFGVVSGTTNAFNPSTAVTFTADANAALGKLYTDAKSVAAPRLRVSSNAAHQPRSYRWTVTRPGAGVEFATAFAGDTRRRGTKNLFSATDEWKSASKAWVKKIGRPGDQAGHVLPNAFGGSVFAANIWPQSPNSNVGSGISGWKEAESHFTKMARGTYTSQAASTRGQVLPICTDVKVKVRFYYDDFDFPLRPSYGYYRVAVTSAVKRSNSKCKSRVFPFYNVPCLPTGRWTASADIWNGFVAMRDRLKATYGAEQVATEADGVELDLLPVVPDVPDPALQVQDDSQAPEVGLLSDDQLALFRAMAAVALRKAGLPTDGDVKTQVLRAAFAKCPAAEHAVAQVQAYVTMALSVEQSRIAGACKSTPKPAECAAAFLKDVMGKAEKLIPESMAKIKAGAMQTPSGADVDDAFDDFVETGSPGSLLEVHHFQALLITGFIHLCA